MAKSVSDFSLQGKVALVTGSSSGLGRHFAKVMAGGGARVIVGARRMQRLNELCNEIADTGGYAVAVEMDVRDAVSIKAAFDFAEQSFGPVNILVNNAGISGPGQLISYSAETWDAVMDTNLKAVWLAAQVAAKRMIHAGVSGSIVNVASILASGCGDSLGPYMAAKAGVVHLTHAMALEWARHNIRVNAIAPGYFPSEMTAAFLNSEHGKKMMARIPLGRFGNLDELSGPLLLLASDASSFMTGSVVTVDGGQLCQSL